MNPALARHWLDVWLSRGSTMAQPWLKPGSTLTQPRLDPGWALAQPPA